MQKVRIFGLKRIYPLKIVIKTCFWIFRHSGRSGGPLNVIISENQTKNAYFDDFTLE